MTTALALSKVTMRYGGVAALDDVSVSVAEGSIHAVIGPNGAGKSSLLNVVSGHARPQRGSLHVAGQDLTGCAAHRIARAGVGRAFQNVAISAHESVLDNLMAARYRLTRAGFAATALGLPGVRREARRHEERVVAIAHLVGLGDKLHSPAGALSYGQRKRVEIARALCTEPRILLLDEPVAGMPASEKWDIAEIVVSARQALGITVVLVEHDLRVVFAMAEEITVLDFGQVIAAGSPDAVVESPAVVAAYLGTHRAAADAGASLARGR